MPDRITLQVTRYRPERETEPTQQSYEVPLRSEWAVLDGLNYVKDQLDGTLSYRWSCRMGICGSCGMTVNGEPKLTCATFLSEYAPGPAELPRSTPRAPPTPVLPYRRRPVMRSAASNGC